MRGRPSAQGFVYLAIDCSASMAGQKLLQAREGALDFAEDAQIKGYSVGLVQFESSAKPESTEGGRLVSILKWPEGAPLNLG